MVSGINFYLFKKAEGKPNAIIENEKFTRDKNKLINDWIIELNKSEPLSLERINIMSLVLVTVRDSAHLLDAYAQPEIKNKGYYLIPFFTDVLLKDKDPEIRILAAEALGHLGGLGHAEVLPALKKALETEDVPKVHNMISSAKALTIFQTSLK